MEAFSLLKYWRTNGGASGGGGATTIDSTANARATTETLVAAAAVSPYSSDGEDGPYFDLQFALPDDDDVTENEQEEKEEGNDKEKAQKNEINEEDETSTETESTSEESSLNEEDEDEDENEEDEDEDENEEEVKFTLATNDTISPSEEQLFCEGDHVVSIDEGSEDINSKFPVSLLKSATKFRVLLLKLKKSKSGNGIPEKLEKNEQVSTKSKKIEEKHGGGKFCTVKFKIEEVKVPLVSLFKRENSSSKDNNKAVNKIDTPEDSDEKKLIKEVVLQKYLKMVKPLYIRVSKRYLENLKFAGQHDSGDGAVTPPCSAAVKAGESVKTNQKQGNNNNNNNNNNNLQAGLKVVRKHLGKSRSASSTVTAATPPEKMASNRRDDSLVQLQDGIQGAILHCKKSFNASRDGESSSSSSSSSSMLCRSTSDSSSSYEKSPASTSS